VLKRVIKSFFNLLHLEVTKKSNGQDAVKGNSYENEALKFKWLKEYNINTIIDVGANEGQFASKIKLVLPMATIHCFEPLEEPYKGLQQNFKDDATVHLYKYGLGASDEEKEIFVNNYTPSSSLLEMLDLHKENFDFAKEAHPERISVRRLDSFFNDNIKRPLLLKIDVQGYEMFVLKGGQNTLQQADILIIETSFYPLYAGQPLFEEIYDYLTRFGFRYIGNIEQLYSPHDNKVLQADAVFVKR
jgi:FkbM family methyltransferase